MTKITTVAPLRSENSDLLMKWKIVGEAKLEHYTDDKHSGTLRVPRTRYQPLLTIIMFAGGVGVLGLSDSA